MTAEQTQSFESWAIVELFGHQKIAGRVSEVPMAGTSFLKVEVPETDQSAAYSSDLRCGSHLTGSRPGTEEQARGYLTRGWGFSHPEFAAKALPKLVLVDEHVGWPGEDETDGLIDDDFELDDR